MKLKLSRPTKVNGSEISELDMDLENLRGKDLLELETGFRRAHRGEYLPVLNIDARYQAWVAGRVSGFNPDDLGELFAPDFAAMCSEVQNFLLGSA